MKGLGWDGDSVGVGVGCKAESVKMRHEHARTCAEEDVMFLKSGSVFL